jgi:prevent-host-death family protein
MQHGFEINDIVSLGDIRKNMRQIVEEVRTGGNPKVIIVGNKPGAVLVNIEDYQRLLSNDLRTMAQLMHEEEARGELEDITDLLDGMASLAGLDLNKTPNSPVENKAVADA